MAFNFRKLARQGEFDCDLNSLGRVRCINLRTSHLSEADEKLVATDVQNLDIVRWLLGEMARHPVGEVAADHDLANDPGFTADELAAVTEAELEEFAEKLIQKNKYLLLKTHKGHDLEKAVDESVCDFLVRAFRHYAAEQIAATERLFAPTRSLFADSTLDSIKKSVQASNKFEDLIKQYASASPLDQIKKSLAASDHFGYLKEQAFDALDADRTPSTMRVEPQILSVQPMHFPKNPILEINQILENLASLIEGMRPLVAQGAESIRCMNDTARRMQTDYVANAVRTDRQTNKAMWVAGLSFLVSALGLGVSSFFSYHSYVDAKSAGEKENAQIKVFKESINTLVTEQRAERAAFLKQIGDANRNASNAKR